MAKQAVQAVVQSDRVIWADMAIESEEAISKPLHGTAGQAAAETAVVVDETVEKVVPTMVDAGPLGQTAMKKSLCGKGRGNRIARQVAVPRVQAVEKVIEISAVQRYETFVPKPPIPIKGDIAAKTLAVLGP